MKAPLFQNILCPVDFSELSALALRYAALMAGCGQARLAVIYANTFLPPPYFTEGQLRDLEQQHRASFGDAERALRRFVDDTLGPGAPGVETRVVEGLPVDGIHAFSAMFKPDLIVMGTHGRSGPNRWLLGSVTERLLREAGVPLLTVRQQEKSSDPAAIRNILCPVNNSPAAREALAVAAELGRCFGAGVTALHVREGKQHDAIPDLCAWVSEENRAACTIREEVREGEAASAILSAAAEMPYDLLVAGASHHLFFDSTVLGTTTVRLARHARCPVLTLISKGGAATS